REESGHLGEHLGNRHPHLPYRLVETLRLVEHSVQIRLDIGLIGRARLDDLQRAVELPGQEPLHQRLVLLRQREPQLRLDVTPVTPPAHPCRTTTQGAPARPPQTSRLTVLIVRQPRFNDLGAFVSESNGTDGYRDRTGILVYRGDSIVDRLAIPNAGLHLSLYGCHQFVVCAIE